MNTLTSGKDLLLSLVLKMGWAASMAALLVRFATFRKILFNENRDSDQKVQLLLFITPPLAIGVFMRLAGYPYFDLTLEGSFLMGLLGGRIVGLLGGSLISLPAFGNHEWLSSPMAALVGLLAGVIRQLMPNKEDIWDFGPFTFLNIPRSIWNLVRHGKLTGRCFRWFRARCSSWRTSNWRALCRRAGSSRLPPRTGAYCCW